MNTRIRASVRAMTPYVPGEQPKLPDIVKLNTYAIIDNELVVVTAISSSSMTVGRGVLDSVPVVHVLGARVFSHPQCHHVPEVYDGIGAEEAERLMKDFFAARR